MAVPAAVDEEGLLLRRARRGAGRLGGGACAEGGQREGASRGELHEVTSSQALLGHGGLLGVTRRREHIRSRVRAEAAPSTLVPVVGQGLVFGGLAEGLPPGGHGLALAVELPQVLVVDVEVRGVGLRVEHVIGQHRALAPRVPRPVEVEGGVLARDLLDQVLRACRRGRRRRRPRPRAARRRSGAGSPRPWAGPGRGSPCRGSAGAPRPRRSAAPPARSLTGKHGTPISLAQLAGLLVREQHGLDRAVDRVADRVPAGLARGRAGGAGPAPSPSAGSGDGRQHDETSHADRRAHGRLLPRVTPPPQLYQGHGGRPHARSTSPRVFVAQRKPRSGRPPPGPRRVRMAVAPAAAQGVS